MVFIPEMKLHEERFVIEDLERIVKASEGLAARSSGPVTMMDSPSAGVSH